MMRSLLRSSAIALGVVLAGCYQIPSNKLGGLSSFQVEVTGVYPSGTQTPSTVVTSCQKQYGGEAKVPNEVRGTADCRYAVVTTALDVAVKVTALDVQGQPLEIDRPVSFRVKPGNLSGDYVQRYVNLVGGVGTGTVQVQHVAGDVRVWVEDGPVQLIYAADGGTGGNVADLPVEPDDRNGATGLSPVIAFQTPTLAMVQTPDNGTSQTDPFLGQYVNIGEFLQGLPPTQSCPEDNVHDGLTLQMVVTGVTAQGFFLTDVTGCRQKEVVVAHTIGEPDGFLPGTYGSMYIYNSSFPDGLGQGDLLYSIAGSVQEFTDTTQLTFASWSIAEHVADLPVEQQSKWISQVPIVDINDRTCGLDATLTPYVSDALCAYSYSNLKMESLESALVRIRNVRFPDTFVNCDLNGDGTVEFFCPYQNIWQACFDTGGVDPGLDERQCNIDCTIGQGAYSGKICTELETYSTYGQFVVEMTPPGPAAAHMDDSLSARAQNVPVNGTAARPTTSYAAGAELAIWCTVDTRVRFGEDGVTASSSDTKLTAKTELLHTLTGSETTVALLSAAGSGTCSVSQNPKTRINVLIRDAVPGFDLNCDENNADAALATQCQSMHRATYDIVGHLNQVAPARPRWLVTPRAVDDICCRPGPGLSCPAPISPCP